MPRATFWRIWGLAAAFIAFLLALWLVNPPQARAGEWHRTRAHHVRATHAAAHHRRRHQAHLARHRVHLGHCAHRRIVAVTSAGPSGDAVAIAMRFLGRGNPTGTHRAWCGDFVNMTERLAGRPGLASGAWAPAWRAYGHASAPVRGAIAIMRGHVARVVRRMGGRVMLISGNWSHRVSIHVAPIRAVLAFRAL